ncbi:hypothetical protein DFH27DRAFT_553387 [Peziza echinospora]|nr:hypothetical protein DFH27DRAFT_553387 [Peziza echinospora]
MRLPRRLTPDASFAVDVRQLDTAPNSNGSMALSCVDSLMPRPSWRRVEGAHGAGTRLHGVRWVGIPMPHRRSASCYGASWAVSPHGVQVYLPTKSLQALFLLQPGVQLLLLQHLDATPNRLVALLKRLDACLQRSHSFAKLFNNGISICHWWV